MASAALTLVQLAAVLSPRELARAYDEALVRRVTGPEAIASALARNPRRRGAPALRRLLASEQPARFTRSEAERRLLELVDAAGLPRPETNVRIHGHEVDALWRADGLVVEVDGYRFRSTRAAFERDRRRDGELQAAGMRVVRVTWRQLTGDSHALIARLARLLALG